MCELNNLPWHESLLRREVMFQQGDICSGGPLFGMRRVLACVVVKKKCALLRNLSNFTTKGTKRTTTNLNTYCEKSQETSLYYTKEEESTIIDFIYTEGSS